MSGILDQLLGTQQDGNPILRRLLGAASPQQTAMDAKARNYKIAPSAPTPNWTPQQEADFQSAVRQTPWYGEFKQKIGEEPDLNTKDYNYRAAWAAGARPSFYAPDGLQHWPGGINAPDGSEISLKAKDHPTAWMNDYYNLTAGADPSNPVDLSPTQVSILQKLLKQRYSGAVPTDDFVGYPSTPLESTNVPERIAPNLRPR